jgi:hypothetical protein
MSSLIPFSKLLSSQLFGAPLAADRAHAFFVDATLQSRATSTFGLRFAYSPKVFICAYRVTLIVHVLD